MYFIFQLASGSKRGDNILGTTVNILQSPRQPQCRAPDKMLLYMNEYSMRHGNIDRAKNITMTAVVWRVSWYVECRVQPTKASFFRGP
jgi:hypothetical protein